VTSSAWGTTHVEESHGHTTCRVASILKHDLHRRALFSNQSDWDKHTSIHVTFGTNMWSLAIRKKIDKLLTLFHWISSYRKQTSQSYNLYQISQVHLLYTHFIFTKFSNLQVLYFAELEIVRFIQSYRHRFILKLPYMRGHILNNSFYVLTRSIIRPNVCFWCLLDVFLFANNLSTTTFEELNQSGSASWILDATSICLVRIQRRKVSRAS
jgi:hypothetical protein